MTAIQWSPEKLIATARERFAKPQWEWNIHDYATAHDLVDACERLLQERDAAVAADKRHVDFWERKATDLSGLCEGWRKRAERAEATNAKLFAIARAAKDHCLRWDHARGHPGFPFNPRLTGETHPTDPWWHPPGALSLAEALALLEPATFKAPIIAQEAP